MANLDLFSPTLEHTQFFAERPLQGEVSAISPLSMDPFSINSIFNFDPASLGTHQATFPEAEMDVMPEISMDQFEGEESKGYDPQIGIDVDDPILSSLATLAEGGGDLGEHMGETQNFNVWEWFEQQ
jgi:hypothetical protein